MYFFYNDKKWDLNIWRVNEFSISCQILTRHSKYYNLCIYYCIAKPPLSDRRRFAFTFIYKLTPACGSILVVVSDYSAFVAVADIASDHQLRHADLDWFFSRSIRLKCESLIRQQFVRWPGKTHKETPLKFFGFLTMTFLIPTRFAADCLGIYNTAILIPESFRPKGSSMQKITYLYGESVGLTFKYVEFEK